MKTHVIPAATNHQSQLAASLCGVKETLGSVPETQKAELESFVKLTTELFEKTKVLDATIVEAKELGEGKEAGMFIATNGLGSLKAARTVADTIEEWVDDSLWSLPKYRDYYSTTKAYRSLKIKAAAKRLFF